MRPASTGLPSHLVTRLCDRGAVAVVVRAVSSGQVIKGWTTQKPTMGSAEHAQ
jgi:hypothetical protein